VQPACQPDWTRKPLIGDLAARSGRVAADGVRQISRALSAWGLSAWAAEQRVRRGPARPLAVDLRLTAGDFRLQHLDPLFQLSDAEQFQILSNRVDEALAATNSDFRRLFHDEHYLSGSPMGGYPTAHARQVQVRTTPARLSRYGAIPMTEMMTAIAIEGGKGPAEALKAVQIPRPEPKAGQILIRVHAAGINRPDIIQRMGFYPPPPGSPETMGLEVAGEVVVGAGRWKAGDKVCALLGGGGYAEYAVCDARHALPIPKGLDFVQAAALPETVFTVFANVFEHGRLQPGETLLVHGATSGIGTTAIQMAKAHGAKVIATARGADKAATALKLGADVAVDTKTQDFAEVVKNQGGADVVLDMVGGDYFAKDLDALKMDGRIVFIASLGGGDVTLSIGRLMQKRGVVTGSTLRPRNADEKARLAAAVEALVWPWIEAGKVAPQVDATFPLADAAKAHAHLEGGAHIGKIVLTMEG
jgi:NADPH2:quinone reductase